MKTNSNVCTKNHQTLESTVPPSRRSVAPCISRKFPAALSLEHKACEAKFDRQIVQASCSNHCTTHKPTRNEPNLNRRLVLASMPPAFLVTSDLQAQAVTLPSGADMLWESLGGGPPDLFYPEEFLGLWRVTSTLVDLELPLGEDFVKQDAKVIQRARNDIDQPLVYNQRFIRGSSGRVISDRAFNLEALVTATAGMNMITSIDWNPDDPNIMNIGITGAPDVFTRVVRRFQGEPDPQRLDTSEVMEQVFNQPDGGPPKIKQSRCLTKYRWRDEAAVTNNGPVIIATQYVSDFVTAFDGEDLVFKAQGKPKCVYSYRMGFQRVSET